MNELTTGAANSPETTLILRLWREGEGSAAVWRCSVEDPSSKQRRGFATLTELLLFLQLLTESSDLRRAFDAGADERKSLEPCDSTP
ncbi:MAG: hypothetical protein B7Z68_01375 [Acidobacteria bacterium 21-70-11]|nr:MAG: hypothetical protein B7Z68_01375 [Acidobacteria bacterium 21-70-11]OYW06854.1 MAG: hypothetical protein B7Z61_00945 [Acidobacteria bacterium 37-71-11]HQT93709.1 hypothetical protein [Thermoanaerobaculaceae bacterium]